MDVRTVKLTSISLCLGMTTFSTQQLTVVALGPRQTLISINPSPQSVEHGTQEGKAPLKDAQIVAPFQLAISEMDATYLPDGAGLLVTHNLTTKLLTALLHMLISLVVHLDQVASVETAWTPKKKSSYSDIK